MPATDINLADFGTTIAFDEPGINVESVEQTARKKTIKVPNKDGNTRGRRDYDKGIDYSISGETVGDPANLGNLGEALTVNNKRSLGGVSTGGIYLDSIKLTMAREQMWKVTMEASQDELVP